MEKIIYDVLKKIENNSYEAYVVGGYVREKIINNNLSFDIDITTSAKPKDIISIFSDYDVELYEYGNVSFTIDNYKFDITTFRKDMKYSNNRKPIKIIYIDSLEEDLKRRDFTINSICIDKDDNIIDYYDGKKDIKKKIIRSIGDPYEKLEEDALRILRAIRFATIYKFKLEENLKNAIIKNKDLLKDLSYERKKEELNKIFSSKHKKYGIKLLKQLDLLKVLELKNIDNALYNNDIIGIWATITDINYAFTKREKELIDKINNLLNENINDPLVQYKYGPYPISIVSNIKRLNTKKIIANYEKLPIKDKNEIKITASEICDILHKKPDSFIKDIMSVLEKEILLGHLENDNDKIKEYISKNFK